MITSSNITTVNSNEEPKAEIVIVTRHPGVVKWLEKQGITGPVYKYVTQNDIYEKRVVGELPAHIAQYAKYLTAIVYERPFKAFGKVIDDIETIEEAGPSLFSYKIIPFAFVEHK